MMVTMPPETRAKRKRAMGVLTFLWAVLAGAVARAIGQVAAQDLSVTLAPSAPP